ncbi:MAG: bifunctional hydroxymethylpyrimidine kinase/phosphomethylpyrimidine kinase [Nitrospirota bacterium]
MRNSALSIAGSDPSGGAGIQADIKVFALLGVYGMAVPATFTVQNTVGVFSVKSRPARSIKEELDAVIADIRPDALKTGMLYSAGVISAVAEAVRRYKLDNLVVDPVTISSSGKRLLKKDAQERLIAELFPLALVVMPNVFEAEALSGMEIKNIKDVEEAAAIIKKIGPKHVLIKGGHLSGAATDVLFDGKNFTRFGAGRVEKEIHGAGCVYSAAVTAGLAKGLPVEDAVRAAKRFIANAIRSAGPVGRGRVPLV